MAGDKTQLSPNSRVSMPVTVLITCLISVGGLVTWAFRFRDGERQWAESVLRREVVGLRSEIQKDYPTRLEIAQMFRQELRASEERITASIRRR